MRPLLLAMPGNEGVVTGLQVAIAADLARYELRRFPDGETYFRLDDDARDRHVVVLCTLRGPDAWLAPLVFAADLLRESGARRVGLVAPYLAYMRQDRRFRPGEAITSVSFARLISRAFDWLVTVDPHLHRRQSLDEIYRVPSRVVHAAGRLAEWVRGHVTRPVIVGPDAESEQWVRSVADAVPCPFVILSKNRHGDRDVAVSALPGVRRWKEHTPVLIDDIVSSAHTMAETVRQCTTAGLPPPVCLGVHAVFAGGADELLRSAGAARVVTTNTIAHPSNGIDVSDDVAVATRTFLDLTDGVGAPVPHSRS
ncbi:MAG: ribose-phosphate pyrophosphokinase [Reyranella sp.]